MKPLPAYRKVKAEVIGDLCRRAQAGDTAARNELIRANMRLVARIATRCARSAGRLDLLDDMIQEAVTGGNGRGGLVRAIELFDPRRGQAFSTFAAFWIHNEVVALLNRQRVVAGSSNAAKRRMRIQRARDDARAKLGRDPTTAEVRSELIASGCTHTSSLRPATIERALTWSFAEWSFEHTHERAQHPPGEGGGGMSWEAKAILIDHDAPNEDDLNASIDGAREADTLRAAIAQLPPDERDAIRKRLRADRTKPASRVEKNAITHLREIMTGTPTQ